MLSDIVRIWTEVNDIIRIKTEIKCLHVQFNCCVTYNEQHCLKHLQVFKSIVTSNYSLLSTVQNNINKNAW